MVSKFRTMVSNAQIEVEVAVAAPSTVVELVASGAPATFDSLLTIFLLAVEKRKRTRHRAVLCRDRTIYKNSSTQVESFGKLSSRKAKLYVDCYYMTW